MHGVLIYGSVQFAAVLGLDFRFLLFLVPFVIAFHQQSLPNLTQLFKLCMIIGHYLVRLKGIVL